MKLRVESDRIITRAYGPGNSIVSRGVITGGLVNRNTKIRTARLSESRQRKDCVLMRSYFKDY